MTELSSEARAIVEGRHSDPFHYLGRHRENDRQVVRAYLPEASEVRVVDEHGEETVLTRIHDAGLFLGDLPNAAERYRFRARYGADTVELEDPYRFPPILSDFDLYLLGEGTHQRLYDKLGAHPMTMDGVEGVGFVVLAPNARTVASSAISISGTGAGIRCACEATDIGNCSFPVRSVGDRYKFAITGHRGGLLPLKSDPMAFAAEVRPDTASIIFDETTLPRPHSAADTINARNAPISIYEVHLGSWRRGDGNRWLSYRELAEHLPRYARDLGFTHIELMPVNEHPFDGSWGYQPTGLYAPTSRFGSPEDFAHLIDACHREGLGVLLDWVPGHFPDDPHGLGHFDGTALYEHANPLQGRHLDWGTLIYNYGRTEVVEFPRRQRAVLARSLWGRWPSRRCRRLHALSRLQPS